MTLMRAIRLARSWASGGVCSARESEAKEYHKAALAAFEAQKDGQPHGQWISVDDRLPDDSLIERQVICTIKPRYGEPYVVALFWWGSRCMNSIWQDVTHWMPLPEPPEED